MGTRSHTIIRDGRSIVAAMYCQFDGYITGLGKDLAEFVEGFKVTNGFSGDDRENPDVKVANGAGCFAAQLITHLKTKVSEGSEYNPKTGQREPKKFNTVGNVYMISAADAKYQQEYKYEIIFGSTKGGVLFTVWHCDEKLGNRLTLEQFKELIKAEEKKEEEDQ